MNREGAVVGSKSRGLDITGSDAVAVIPVTKIPCKMALRLPKISNNFFLLLDGLIETAERQINACLVTLQKFWPVNSGKRLIREHIFVRNETQ